MAGRMLPRWLFSWLCRWFPGWTTPRRQPVTHYTKPMLIRLEDRFSPTSLSIAEPVELAPPLLSFPG